MLAHFFFFNYSLPRVYTGYLIAASTCLSQVTDDGEDIFTCLLVILMSSLVKLFHLFFNLTNVLSYNCLIITVLYIFQLWVLYQMNYLQIFSPNLMTCSYQYYFIDNAVVPHLRSPCLFWDKISFLLFYCRSQEVVIR